MSRPLLIILISVLVMMGPFSNNIVVPSLPAIADALAVSYGDAQLVLSVFMVGFAAGQLVVGPMSDRFGRKPVLAVSLALFVAASIACALAPSLGLLVAARLVQALGVSATMSIGRAIVRDAFDSARIAQMYAYVGTSLAIGPIIGPVFGGLIQAGLGWRSVLGFTAVVGVLILLAIVTAFRETNPHRDPSALRPARMFGNYGRLLRTPGYMGYVMCNAICYGGIFTFTSCSAYVLIELLKMTPGLFGLTYAITVGGYAVGTLAASHFTRRVGIDRMIVIGGLVMTIAGEALVLLPLMGHFTVWTVVVPFAIFAFGTGFVFPNGQAGAIGPYPKMAGSASSMLSFLQMAFAAAVGALTARLLDGTMMPMAVAIMVMGPAMLLSFYLLVLRRRAVPAGA